MPTILQVNFSWDISEEQLAEHSNPKGAEMFWKLSGLKWKVWLRDEERRESGGIYLFETREAAQAYLDGPIVERLKKIPGTSNHSMKLFDVREGVSAVTGAPLEVEMTRG